jgi:hypothetical protein
MSLGCHFLDGCYDEFRHNTKRWPSTYALTMNSAANSELCHHTAKGFSTDNGPHTLADPSSLNPEAAARSGGQLAATNGLRQCKASVFEGGIRVPSFIAWPKMMGGLGGGANRRTGHVTSSLDFMATVNEIIGVPYPKVSWTVDSKSVLPLLDGRCGAFSCTLCLPLSVYVCLQWLSMSVFNGYRCLSPMVIDVSLQWLSMSLSNGYRCLFMSDYLCLPLLCLPLPVYVCLQDV